MRKRLLLSLGLLGLVLLGGYLLLWLTAPRHRVSQLGWQQIEAGMTQEEVERVLGGPPGDYASQPYDLMRRQLVPGRWQMAVESFTGFIDGMGLAILMAPRVATELYVQDTGSGIPHDQLDKIFQAFYQVDGGTTRTHGGSGLGLAIVRRLVDAHGGEVRVESQLGRGTTFRVLLPEG
jgi:hypothetical protein